MVEGSDVGPNECVTTSCRAKEMCLDVKRQTQSHGYIWMKSSTKDIFDNKVDRSASESMNVMYNTKTVIKGCGPRVKKTKSSSNSGEGLTIRSGHDEIDRGEEHNVRGVKHSDIPRKKSKQLSRKDVRSQGRTETVFMGKHQTLQAAK